MSTFILSYKGQHSKLKHMGEFVNHGASNLGGK